MTEKRKTVSKDLNNHKILKEVQATSDEASRLLADLDSSSNNKSSNTKKTNSQKINRGPHQPYKYPLNEDERRDKLGNIVGIVLISAIILASIINSGNKSSNFAPTTKRQMNTTEQSFYSKALRQAEDAVLIREHKSAISDLETLKRGKYKDLVDINHGIVNNKIIQANRAITYLDQPGDSKYVEFANHGSQWFDNTRDNFKIFFAYTKSCKNPMITFRYIIPETDKVVKTTKIRPKAYISNITVPHYGQNAVGVQNFKCN